MKEQTSTEPSVSPNSSPVPTERAGARASRMLPVCFLLLESALEALALAQQAQDAGVEDPAFGDPSAPRIAADVAVRAMSSLQVSEYCYIVIVVS